MTIRSLPKVGTDKVQNTYQYGEAATNKTKGQPQALASMESLRGPLARLNRANLNHNRDDGTRDRAPVELRYPHNSKRWGLGVGQVPGERALEGVFAIGKGVKADGVIFTASQLICPFRGHQQSKRPTHLTHHAWAHNGIPEGMEGCLYINAYHNTDSPVRWLRMAGHEDMANCKI